MNPLFIRRTRRWDTKTKRCRRDSSSKYGSGVIMPRARVAFVTSAALLFSCAWITGTPIVCSAFLVQAPSAVTSRCTCNSEQFYGVGRSNSLRRPLAQGTSGATNPEWSDDLAGGFRMLWSGGKRTKGNEVTVNIERPGINSRRISGSIVINRPIEVVWLTLTDYNRLAEYVPNLTQSTVRGSDDGTIRLWQEGAQKIVGFDFRASVEMFMDEHFGDPENKTAQRKLTFGLLKSRMFQDFFGEWRMQFNSRKQRPGPQEREYEYSTKLFYMVNIKPKGPVPVLALEWQISNEVPNNLKGLKRAAESATPEYVEMRRKERNEFEEINISQGLDRENGCDDDQTTAKVGAEAFVPRGNDIARPEWDTDETLEAYIAKG